MSTPLELAFACPACGRPVEGGLTPDTERMACPHCGAETALPECRALLTRTPLCPCPVCGSRDLYWQRDFNRKLGITVVVVGSILGPFTHWISIAVAALIDAALYLVVPSVTVCYACNAQLRGFADAARPAPFDIAIHDVYKFDKRHPPRPEAAVAGPLETRRRQQAGGG